MAKYENGKRCDTCKKWLDKSGFYNNKYKPDGLSSTCKSCQKEIKERKEKHYDYLYEKQQGACAICGKSVTRNGKALTVDHDHGNGHVRGLLCNSCNSGLGSFEDNTLFLQRAITYLVNSRKQ